MRRAFPAVLAVLMVLAGCGGSQHSPPPPPVQHADAHACRAGDYFMGCGPHKGLLRSGPLLERTVAQGIDFAWGGPSVGWMQRAGAKFGASYLSYDSSKNWPHSLVAAYHRAGIGTVFVWETTSTRCLDGYAAGRSDATAAIAQARTYGFPTASRPIFTACDTDTTGMAGRIDGYYRGWNSVEPPSRTGGYGGFDTIRYLRDHGLARYFWMAGAWDYGRGWLPYAQLQQYGYGDSLDWNRATSPDYGQWPYGTPRNWLQRGDRGGKVWLFTHRLAIAGWLPHSGSFYSLHVAQVVRAYQARHRLNPVTGVAGGRTQRSVRLVAAYDRRHNVRDH